jgi:hypothetical protein
VLTQTINPMATAAPPPPAAADPRPRLGKPIWTDNFKDGANWPVFSDNHVKMGLVNGGLQMTAFASQGWDSWMYTKQFISNFYLEETASPGACSGLDRYGLLARSPGGSSGYVFGFSCDGRYSLRKYDGSQFTMLVNWTASSAIHTTPGQANRLGLKAQGDQMTLYANGDPLTSVKDSSFSSGAIGLFISSENTANFPVLVSEISYWNLP